jgi:hypothetical protein
MNAADVSAREVALNSYLKSRERMEQVKSLAVVASEKFHDLFLMDDGDPYELAEAEAEMNHLWDCFTNEVRKVALEERYARKIGVIE